MNIIIPVYIVNEKKVEIILDQLYVTMESYYFHGNTGTFIIYTNNDAIEKGVNLYKTVYERDILIVRLDFESVWKDLNLPINESRTRREFIISKMIVPFIFDDDYLTMDWDILTTGKMKPEYIISDKLRLFLPKFHDGVTLRQDSFYRKLEPETSTIGNFRWMNSGMIYSPAKLSAKLLREYWDLYHSIRSQIYRGIFLYDIIGDELIYNLMMLHNEPNIEEFRSYNINAVFRNFYYIFDDVDSMFTFGSKYPNLYSVHFSGGHVKPYEVIVDDQFTLTFPIVTEKYVNNKKNIKWTFDMRDHRLGSFHFNALMFSIVWQYTRYSIREKLGLTKEIISNRYSEFFKVCFIDE
jgi:hypothetical protein